MKMEDCKYIQDLLPLYVDDGVLSVAECRAVDEHIAHCGECAAELRDLQENASLLHLAGRSIFQAPADLSSRVMEQLRAEAAGSILSEVPVVRKLEPGRGRKAQPRASRWVSGIAAVAVLAVSVASGIHFLSGESAKVAQEAEPPAIVAPESEPAPAEIAVPETEPAAVSPDPPAADEQQPEEAIVTETVTVASVDAETEPETTAAAPAEETPAVQAEPPAPAAETVTVAEAAPPEETAAPEAPAYTEPVPSGNVILLNQNDQVRSTMLRMSFSDVEAAVVSLQTLVSDCGGRIVDTTVSADSNSEIFSVKVPRAEADNFIVSVTSSGFVLSQEQDFKTSLYSQLMEEYLQLQTQLNASASEEVAIQLRTQLSEVEQQMNAAQQDAQYESVVIWVQMSE